MERTIAISEHLANRLEGYLQQHPHESLSSLLEEILQHKAQIILHEPQI
jgi:hypothetical protein